jgi:UDP-N-acetylglucosamine 2-epimerase (non-hydrolysing)
LPYHDLIRLLRCTALVLSDSGGIQEEVASFGVRVLVLRDVTERMEAVAAGFATLVGTDAEVIIGTARRMLADDRHVPVTAARGGNPFGDGMARYRAEQAIAWYLGLESEPPMPFCRQSVPGGTAVVSAEYPRTPGPARFRLLALRIVVLATCS